MANLLVVTGATGLQGTGVINAVSTTNPDWKIRGITRNIHSEKALALSAQGIEMVAADLDDAESLTARLCWRNGHFRCDGFLRAVCERDRC
jgi:uncharacterized protein YbjT (DUF2867 family)